MKNKSFIFIAAALALIIAGCSQEKKDSQISSFSTTSNPTTSTIQSSSISSQSSHISSSSGTSLISSTTIVPPSTSSSATSSTTIVPPSSSSSITPPIQDIIVTFETNGGTKACSIKYEGERIVPPLTEKYNYEFLGWFTNPSYGGEPIDFATFAPTSSCTLYAKWGRVSYLYLYYGESTDHERYTYHSGDFIDLSTLYIPEPITIRDTLCPFVRWVHDFTYEEAETTFTIGDENIYLVAEYDKSNLPRQSYLVEIEPGVYTNSKKTNDPIFLNTSGYGYYSADITFEKGIDGGVGLTTRMQAGNTDFSYESPDESYISCVLYPGSGSLNFNRVRGEDGVVYSSIKTVSFSSLPTSWQEKFNSYQVMDDITVNLSLLTTPTSITAYIDGEKVNYTVAQKWVDMYQGTSFGIRTSSLNVIYRNFKLSEEKVQVNFMMPDEAPSLEPIDYYVGAPIEINDRLADYGMNRLDQWFYDKELTRPLDKLHPDFNGNYVLYPKYSDHLNIGKCDGAIVNANDIAYITDEEVIIHVEPIGNNSILNVKYGDEVLNELDSDQYGHGFYRLKYKNNLTLTVETSISTTPDFTVNLHQIDHETGAITNLETKTISGNTIEIVDEYRYKINAPIVDGYVANNDYIYVLRDTSKVDQQIDFYYSKLSEDTPSKASLSLSGAGTELNPYLIKTPADWLYLTEHASENNYYKLTSSLSLSGSNSFQVGKYTSQLKVNSSTTIVESENVVPFKGHLDGNNCSIRGITTSLVKNADYTTALFGLVGPDSSISNLSTYGTISNSKNHGKAAGFVGYANGGIFENLNSYVEVAHSNGANATNGAIGGIISTALLNSKSVTLINCSNYGSVSRKSCTKSSATENSARSGFGGIVGLATNDENSLILNGCNNFGNIANTGGIDANNNQAYGTNTGGMIGYSQWAKESEINNCSNFAHVLGGSYVGGCTGNSGNADVNGFTNFGEIESVESTFTYSSSTYTTNGDYSSGVFGYMSLNEDITISNVKNFGHVKSSKGNIGGLAGQISGNAYSTNLSNIVNLGNIIKSSSGTDCGGIVGYLNTKTIANNLYNYGFVSSQSGNYTAGLIARLGPTVGSSFIDCVNGGAVYASSAGTAGCLGYFSNTTDKMFSMSRMINNGKIHNTANITGGILGQMLNNSSFVLNDCVNNGQIQGVDYVAGIVGESKNPNSVIQNCINNGNVSGNTRVAGIAGYICTYYLDEVTNMNFGNISGRAYTNSLYGEITVLEV